MGMKSLIPILYIFLTTSALADDWFYSPDNACEALENQNTRLANDYANLASRYKGLQSKNTVIEAKHNALYNKSKKIIGNYYAKERAYKRAGKKQIQFCGSNTTTGDMRQKYESMMDGYREEVALYQEQLGEQASEIIELKKSLKNSENTNKTAFRRWNNILWEKIMPLNDKSDEMRSIVADAKVEKFKQIKNVMQQYEGWKMSDCKWQSGFLKRQKVCK
jgi:hypothetical protein